MALCIPSRPVIAPARSLVIAAGGGRDLAWPHQRVAAELLARSGGRLVHLLLHGGARGADAAIARAADQLGWCSLVMPAQWQHHGRAAGPIRNRELLQQAIARAEAHTSPACLASVLVVAFPGGPGTASLVQQAKRLTALATADNNRADALETSLVLVLTRLQPKATRFSFPNHELTSRKSQAVEIDDEEALDPQWLAVTTTTKPDKAAIKEALKAGHQIKGAVHSRCRSGGSGRAWPGCWNAAWSVLLEGHHRRFCRTGL